MKKLMRKLDSKFIAAKLRFDEIMSNENGMETLETVIVVILAIVVAGAVITMIGKNQDDGILKLIYTKIKDAIDEIFKTT